MEENGDSKEAVKLASEETAKDQPEDNAKNEEEEDVEKDADAKTEDELILEKVIEKSISVEEVAVNHTTVKNTVIVKEESTKTGQVGKEVIKEKKSEKKRVISPKRQSNLSLNAFSKKEDKKQKEKTVGRPIENYAAQRKMIERLYYGTFKKSDKPLKNPITGKGMECLDRPRSVRITRKETQTRNPLTGEGLQFQKLFSGRCRGETVRATVY
ncbi:DgyrCDS11773 [Dimorphilus gyrociliatus]|uniref:DgyrCDS11773 n=1 Tax=Dimorphilus gyrociliatus TaxID=2664684 RepID=A0A7I8W4F5_9ANNE|nr:DgyrCDS11773 [Dimorphilus gyrociliatus]